MRIELHDVRDEALAEFMEDFADRIGRVGHGWWHFVREYRT
ncbi:hypothetical protein [Nocardiopsis sp. CA-288880]